MHRMAEALCEGVAAHDAPSSFREVQDLYLAAFPAEERAVVSTHRTNLLSGRSRLWLSRWDGRAVGFALGTRLTTGAWLLEHLASEPALRGRGVGGRLLSLVCSDLTAQNGTTLYLEVEDPDLDPADPWRVRRLFWYQRQGALPVGEPGNYAMPNLLTGSPLYMRLLAMPLSLAVVPSGGSLCLDLKSLYKEVYGLPPQNLLVLRTLRAFGC